MLPHSFLQKGDFPNFTRTASLFSVFSMHPKNSVHLRHKENNGCWASVIKTRTENFFQCLKIYYKGW